jgi:4-hydroxyphenylpyruvate dioxygenase-like putative hemolysin
MPSPPPTYYKNLKSRAGDVLSDEQIKECEELGILVDRDDQGTLLQIFTKPVGDRYLQNFFDFIELYSLGFRVHVWLYRIG